MWHCVSNVVDPWPWNLLGMFLEWIEIWINLLSEIT